MYYKFFDVETTGMSKRDEVIQIAVIKADIETLNVVEVVNEYCFPTVQIHPEAQRRHGLSMENVLELSKGQTFEQIVASNPIFHERDGAWVSFSSNNFDASMCNNTLNSNGFKPIKFGRTINMLVDKNSPNGLYNVNLYKIAQDNFLRGTIRPLTITTTLITGYSKERLDLMYKLFQKYRKSDKFAHDALYDSYLMWLMLSKMRGRVPVVL